MADLAVGRRTVVAPATSANLGPGFDAFGLALGLSDQVDAEVADSGVVVEVDGEGADSVARDEGNLVARSMLVAFAALGVEPPGLRLWCRNAIPHGRGLGSSAAAIVSGILLADALVDGADLSSSDALSLATQIEGHPDNVAACLLGGFTVAWTSDGGANAVRMDVHPEVRPVAFVPPEAVSTEIARGLLPPSVPHGDASANAGRAALLVAALTARPGLLLDATEDRLHQAYRRPAMPASLDLVDALRAAGVAAVVSGAGPTVLALGMTGLPIDVGRWKPEGWLGLELDVDNVGATVVGSL